MVQNIIIYIGVNLWELVQYRYVNAPSNNTYFCCCVTSPIAIQLRHHIV